MHSETHQTSSPPQLPLPRTAAFSTYVGSIVAGGATGLISSVDETTAVAFVSTLSCTVIPVEAKGSEDSTDVSVSMRMRSEGLHLL